MGLPYHVTVLRGKRLSDAPFMSDMLCGCHSLNTPNQHNAPLSPTRTRPSEVPNAGVRPCEAFSLQARELLEKCVVVARPWLRYC
jgi:hypothetical protein